MKHFCSSEFFVVVSVYYSWEVKDCIKCELIGGGSQTFQHFSNLFIVAVYYICYVLLTCTPVDVSATK